MANLAKQAQGRLNRAADADRDPADLSAGSEASTAADTADSRAASISAGGNAGTVDSMSAGDTVSGSTSKNDSATASGRASSTGSRPAGRKSDKPASRSASSKASKAKTKRGRRVGRPAGPERTAITVRVLVENDQALTEAVAETGQSPQYIVDEALAAWLRERGYLAAD